MWHSNYGQGETDVVDFNSPDDKNNTYTITLDEAEDIVRFIYVPKQTTGGSDNGIITKLNLYGSEDDGDTYTKINEQEIIWARNRTKKEVNFAPRKIKKLRSPEILSEEMNPGTNATFGTDLKASFTNLLVSSASSVCLLCFFSVLIKVRESNHCAPSISSATIMDERRSP